MKNPTISVIVPVYNSEKYLHRCIDSILAQTYTDFELLLIDDGSTDSSGAICDEYAQKDKRVRVFHKENGGVSPARNMGLENAIGEWVTFVDSDDYTDSQWLKNYIDLICINQVDLVCQGFKTDKPLFKGLKTNSYGINFKGNVVDCIETLFRNNILGFCWNKLFLNQIIETHNIRYNEKISLREDEIFVMQYLLYTKSCICTNKIGYFYSVPEWNLKYKLSTEEEETAYKTLFTITENLFQKRKSEVYQYYLHHMTDFFVLQCIENKAEKYKYINEIQKIIKKDFFHTPIFILIKSVIFICPLKRLNLVLISNYYNLKKYFLKYEK